MIRPSNRATWLDMSDTSAANMTASSGLVSKVLNKFGNGNNVQQNTSSAQPKNNVATQNGLPVLRFAHDGAANDFMVFDSNDVFDEPFTIFLVAQSNTTAAVQGLIGRQVGSSLGSYVTRRESDGGVFNSFLFGTGGSSQAANTSNNNANIHNIYFQNGGALNYAINNGAFNTGAVRSGYDNTTTNLAAIGASNGSGSNPMDGWIGEVIVYNAILTTSEITQINQYLSRKWGIAIS